MKEIICLIFYFSLLFFIEKTNFTKYQNYVVKYCKTYSVRENILSLADFIWIIYRLFLYVVIIFVKEVKNVVYSSLVIKHFL